ncbi:MAG: LuxR C-terminal-related transcriptional regulator [Treponema sp.]|jgi:LuxR family maltose regulon positive regulatory protein|nr:LuxR C-terminal-related transcriptional regulator [Treponema sp.]
MPDQLFHSNVPIAPGNRSSLERPQIDALLERAVQSPAVSVIAGTGYGKTHSVYSFLQKYNMKTIWTQFSESDNFPDRFWEKFTAVVGLANRDGGAQLAELGFPRTERQFERYTFIPTQYPSKNRRLIVVFDDFHVVQDKRVLRFIEQTLARPFFNTSAILISRNDPDINLMPLLSKGLLAQITEDDLRFSQEEMLAYFRIQHIRLSPESAAAIYRDTEGWAFAIHLAGLSLKNAPPGAGYVPSAMRSNIFKLIESEIIADVSPGLRKFLIKLSLVEHLSKDLLEHIAEDTGDAGNAANGRGLIEEMEGIGSFISFDAYLRMYRIHQLLLEYLSGRQGELTAAEKREVWNRAAEWYVRNNQKIDAISYYEKSENYLRLAETIYTLPQMVPSTVSEFLLDLLGRVLPKMDAGSDEYMRLYHVYRPRHLILLGRFEEAEGDIKTGIAYFESRPETPIINQILYSEYYLWGIIRLFLCLYNRDYELARYFKQADYYFHRSPDLAEIHPAHSYMTPYVCRIGYPAAAGEFEQYLESFSRSMPYMDSAMNGNFCGADDLIRTEIALYRCNPEKAEQFAHSAVRRAREKKQFDIVNQGLFFLLRINLVLGNFDAISGILKQLEAELEMPDYTNRYLYNDIIPGWFFAHIGQIGKVASWLKNDFEESESNSLVHGFETIVKAKCLFAEKRYPVVLTFFQSREYRFSLGETLLGRLGMNILEAVCLYHNGDREESFRTLEAAYSLAAPNSFDLPFVELGKDMRTLTGAALQDGSLAIPRDWLEKIQRSASAYAKKLFALSEQYGPAAKGRRHFDQSPGVRLSPREQKILTGLSQGLTRNELAEDNAISINTVKSVIRSLYNKMGAINQADAIRIAVSLGLLLGGGKDS